MMLLDQKTLRLLKGKRIASVDFVTSESGDWAQLLISLTNGQLLRIRANGQVVVELKE